MIAIALLGASCKKSNDVETAKKVMNSVSTGQADEVKTFVTDDFVLTGPAPKPIRFDEWAGMHRALLAGIPDFKFNIGDATEEGNIVRLTVQITGTNTGDLDLTAMGLPKIRATNKPIKMPVEHVEIAFVNGKASKAMLLDNGPENGMGGILKQLGVKPPSK